MALDGCSEHIFLLTRPSRDVTVPSSVGSVAVIFLLTRPSRDVTGDGRASDV